MQLNICCRPQNLHEQPRSLAKHVQAGSLNFAAQDTHLWSAKDLFLSLSNGFAITRTHFAQQTEAASLDPDWSGDVCQVANMTEMRKSEAKESEVNHRFVEHAQWYELPTA